MPSMTEEQGHESILAIQDRVKGGDFPLLATPESTVAIPDRMKGEDFLFLAMPTRVKMERPAERTPLSDPDTMARNWQQAALTLPKSAPGFSGVRAQPRVHGDEEAGCCCCHGAPLRISSFTAPLIACVVFSHAESLETGRRFVAAATVHPR